MSPRERVEFEMFVQVWPSRDRMAVPSRPTATKAPLPQVTSSSRLSVPETCWAQMRPSGELISRPERPTATNRLLQNDTSYKKSVIPQGTCVHEVPPSEEIAINPPPPT